MFKIGEFARLTRVSIKTLRHYDEIDLFKPAQIDPWSGYRYYSMAQLPNLNRILALRGLGFALDQIRQMLGADVSVDELRGMLRLRQAQLQQQMETTRTMLGEVEVRLRQIEQEGNMMIVEVLTKDAPSLTVVGARDLVPTPALMRERCMALNAAAWTLLKQLRLQTDGVSFALYYSGDEEGIDVEMAYAVEPPAAPFATGSAATIHTLPAVTVAYAVYVGSYDDFGAVGQVHEALHRWIAEHGLEIAGPSREFYLHPPQSPDDRTGIMEIQYPVVRK